MTKISSLIITLGFYILALVNTSQQQQLINTTTTATCNFTACNVQRTPCSSNPDCECFSLTPNANVAICGSGVFSCNGVVRCNADNKTCPISNTVCVNSTRCNQPICYPVALANKLVCPTVVKATTATTTKSTTKITATTRATSTASATTPTTTTINLNSTSNGTNTTTSAPIIYTQYFTTGTLTVSSPQCSAWLTFQSQLIPRPYTSLIMKGSNDPIGITLTDSTYVAAIANALQTNTSYGPVSSDGYSWSVGICATLGNYYELTAAGNVCTCNTGYTVRPCIGNFNWGGINGSTCYGTDQIMTVIFQ